MLWLRGGVVGRRSATTKLASYERRHRELAAQLGAIGFIASGSIAQRYTRCGKASCACGADPPRPMR